MTAAGAKHICLISFILLFHACKSTRAGKGPTGDTQVPAQMAPTNSCQIVAGILSVEPIEQSEDSTALCSKFPCKAWIKISRVSACGSAIGSGLQPGDSILVHFAFSLAPTSLASPAVKPAYPGLKTGDYFKAWMEMRLQPGHVLNYRIYGYQLQ